MNQAKVVGVRVSDQELIENHQRWIEHHRNVSAAARSYEPPMPRKTFAGRIASFHSRNLDQRYPDGVVAPGTSIVEEKKRLDKNGNALFTTVRTKPSQDAEMVAPPDWLVAKSTVQVDSQGNLIQQWMRMHPQASEAVSILDGIKQAVDSLTDVPGWGASQKLVLPDEEYHEDLLTLRPLPDLHLGMFAWGRETGTDWDLKIAMAKIRDTMAHLDQHCPTSEVGVVLGGGDMLHCDNKRNQTDRSGNPLDVDSRFSKVKEQALLLLVFQIELARAKHKRVVVRMLPGNHDELFADSAAWFLNAWYRDATDVTVDTDPGDFWFYRHGDVMLAGNHGHKTPLTKLPRIMSTYKREMWGETKWSYAHGFHLHHKEKLAWEEGGVVGEIHQAPIPPDAYHHGAGYGDSGRTMCVITYHKQKGETGRWTEPCQ